jgi:sporulation protein YlmC with PRC-barrel domain
MVAGNQHRSAFEERRGSMAESTEFTIGARASCADGPCGQVVRVVIDPIARKVTDLIVEPPHRSGLGRLVPLELVADADPDDVRLGCSLAQFEQLSFAEETHFVPGNNGGYGGYATGEAVAWPFYTRGSFGALDGDITDAYDVVVDDVVPTGDVTVRRGDQVQATDGAIGSVQGFVVDEANHGVTHVLLQEGHLWGRKEVAIPIGAVTRVEEGDIELNLSKQQVEDLPPVGANFPGDDG